MLAKSAQPECSDTNRIAFLQVEVKVFFPKRAIFFKSCVNPAISRPYRSRNFSFFQFFLDTLKLEKKVLRTFAKFNVAISASDSLISEAILSGKSCVFSAPLTAPQDRRELPGQ